MAKKIYVVENYFIIEDTVAPFPILRRMKKDVEVIKVNRTATLYRFVDRIKQYAEIEFSEMVDEKLVPFTNEAAFEKFVNENTGTVNSGGFTNVIDVTMTLDTSAYASGDVLTDTVELATMFRRHGLTGIIQSVQILDEDNQGQPLDIVFLNSNQSLGTKNNPINLSDAIARTIVGMVKVESTDYFSLGNSQFASKNGLGIAVKGDAITSLYMAMISRGTGTYSASGIRCKISVLQD